MNLLDPVGVLNGVGPKTEVTLNKFGIKTVRDFLYTLPRDYENFQAITESGEIRPGKIVVKGKIEGLKTRRARRRNLSITEGIINGPSGQIRVVWFNQAYRLKEFDPRKEYLFTGNYELKNGRYQLISPSVAEAREVGPSGGLIPIYVAHGALRSGNFHHLVEKSRPIFADIPDLLPTVAPGRRAEALFRAHFPNSIKDTEEAREYLAYEELFELILASKLNRRENDKLKAVGLKFEAPKIKKFVAELPFALTNAQRRAAWEIFLDMEKTTPMNRLLQGDVGSGKTIVAGLSAYEAINGGVQVALIAPTAILASQHYEKLQKLLGKFEVQTALLTGATRDKPGLKAKIRSGEINLVVGTHALLTDDTEFKNLGLVIIDEQHRFGVEQRQKLLLKSPSGLAPHLLTMTATPIPRSLQLTVFGDLAVSVLDELPKGRQPITTQIMAEVNTREYLYPEMARVLAAGQQIYWICKLVEESGKSEATSVKSRCEKLRKIFPKARIEFLHGKMKPAEKDAIMEEFSDGKIQILVSTTVVEVGVDVPNATEIIIENAESYGLAQLHQLRGRVGRGSEASRCFLLTSGETRPSRRLRELEKSTDGFYLAEVDLKLRGPGEIYGALQHGALDLRIASLSDVRLIHQASADVDKFLQNPENMLKYKELMAGITKYQQITTLN